MTTIKVAQPPNIAAIRKHFEKQLSDSQNKLISLNKKKIELERDIAMFKEGIAWCKAVK